MSNSHRSVLIIAGGSGTRLWPMSRKDLPKQFQPLFGSETPFQLMVRLVSLEVPLRQIYVIAIPEYKEIILEQVPGFSPENILFEPAQRDTGPAVTLGILQILQRDPEATVATMWSDHLILDTKAFGAVIRGAFEAAEQYPDYLISVGSKPSKADPSLGYIEMAAQKGVFSGTPVYTVAKFTEKPDQNTADQFLTSGKHLWNVGYNIMRAAAYLEELVKHNADLKAAVTTLQEHIANQNTEGITEVYETFPKISIDYLLVQKLEKKLVVPADMGWSDIGTWATLHEMMVAKTGNHLVTEGEVRSINTQNSLVFAKDRPITLVGVKDLVVVDTGDTILIMNYHAPAADLKSLVQNTLPETNPELL